jgi:hypothetical protein
LRGTEVLRVGFVRPEATSNGADSWSRNALHAAPVLYQSNDSRGAGVRVCRDEGLAWDLLGRSLESRPTLPATRTTRLKCHRVAARRAQPANKVENLTPREAKCAGCTPSISSRTAWTGGERSEECQAALT